MPLNRILPACLLALAAAACSETPEQAVYDPPVDQEMLQASHWDILAADNAAAIARAAKKFPGTGSYFVEPLDATMPFARAFREQLTTHLLRHGLKVSLARADAAYRVHFTVQPLRHEAGRKSEPGTVLLAGTALGGLYALRSFGTDIVGPANLLLAGAAGEMVNAGAFGFGPADEIAITVSVMKATDILHRSQALYFVERKDAFHYAGTTPAAPLGLVSGGPAEPPPLREFPINGR